MKVVSLIYEIWYLKKVIEGLRMKLTSERIRYYEIPLLERSSKDKEFISQLDIEMSFYVVALREKEKQLVGLRQGFLARKVQSVLSKL